MSWTVKKITNVHDFKIYTFSSVYTLGMFTGHKDSYKLCLILSLICTNVCFRHADVYDAVFAFHGILGETPRRLRVCGTGSYDGKHEAVLNV